jgi:hypothetical protein
LLLAYAQAVVAFDKPLVWEVLLPLWLSCLGALLWAGRASGLGLGAGLLFAAAALLLADPAEVWFVPSFAVAYLPAASGLGVAVLLAVGPRTGPAQQTGFGLALLLVAMSVEVGALVVLCFGGLFFLWRFLARATDGPVVRASAVAPGFACAIAVAVVLMGARIGTPGEVALPGLAGNAWGSLHATAFRALPNEFLAVPWRFPSLAGASVSPKTGGLLLGAACKGALLVALWFGIPRLVTSGRRAQAAMLGIALLLTLPVSVWFSYMQFGIHCCNRQAGLRQVLLLGGVVALVAALPKPAIDAEWRHRTAVVLAAGGLALLLMLRIPAVVHDWQISPSVVGIRSQNWAAGRTPGPSMVFRPEPISRLAGGVPVPAGTSWRSGDPLPPPAHDLGRIEFLSRIGHFFGKDQVSVPR